MEIFTQSDIGLVRQKNEDAYRYGFISDNIAWAVVCDGMGGEKAGNIASSTAADTVARLIKKEYDPNFNDDRTVDFLSTVVQKANEQLYQMQKNDPNLHGMGTTLELVLATESTAHVIHVGDSRVYGIRGNMIQQVTVDHSVVQEMVDSGEITPEQAQHHPRKNYITRALGIMPELHMDYIEVPFQKKDMMIMCTDGLSNYISMESILDMAHTFNGAQLTNEMINSAKELGGSDNITVAIIYG